MEFQVYMSGSQYRWRLLANNRETIASGEAYHNKADCLNAVELVKSSSTATIKDETKSTAAIGQP
jgi:uncharacterized protein YegP (UPF0339 family)